MKIQTLSRPRIHGTNWVAVIALLPLLGGSQSDGSSTPTVSLEEAKKTTAEFKGQSFTPPETVNRRLVGAYLGVTPSA